MNTEIIMDIDEQSLTERAREDKEAFLALYRNYYPKLYGYLLVRTRNREASEDLTQEAFVKALKALKGGQYRGNSFGAWLFTIARNEMVSSWRKEHRVLTLEPEELEAHVPAVSSPQDGVIRAEDDTLFAAKHASLTSALKKLSVEEQELISMKYIAGLAYEQIGRVLKKKPKTLAVQVFRILKKLRASITQTV